MIIHEKKNLPGLATNVLESDPLAGRTVPAAGTPAGLVSLD